MTFCRGWEVYGAISTLCTLTRLLTKHKHQNFASVEYGIMPLTHDKARAVICKVCVKKKGCVRPVTERYEDLISRHYRSDLDPKDESLPTGICQLCRQALNNIESGRPGAGRVRLPPADHFDYG